MTGHVSVSDQNIGTMSGVMTSPIAGLLCGVVRKTTMEIRGPGYGHPLHNLGAVQAAITFKCASFPTCYGSEFIAEAVRGWILAVTAKTAFIEFG
jgi:hypothetical protein